MLIWRWASRASRTLVLIRPTIFLLVRLGSLVLRAVMSKTHYGLGELSTYTTNYSAYFVCFC